MYTKNPIVARKIEMIVKSGDKLRRHLNVNGIPDDTPWCLHIFFEYSSLYMLKLNTVLIKKNNLKNIN